ncbi:MAG: YciI family protein [Planctomycetota bacterium]|jgi:uncharacterized protein YciI
MLRILSICFLLPFVSCAGSNNALDPDGGYRDFVFVFLKTGPAKGLSDARVQELSAGHFENIDRLWMEGDLLIAGPLGDPKPDPNNRGIFVFDVSSVERAEELTKTDPAVEAGIFRLEAYPFASKSPIREVYALDHASKDRGAEEMRSYVLAVTEDLVSAEVALADDEAVVFHGRLGGELNGSALFALNAKDVSAAKAILAKADPEAGIDWQLHPWYGSANLVALKMFAR